MISAASIHEYQRAVNLCFELASSTSLSSRELLQGAQQYCEQVEHDPAGWNLIIGLYCSSSDPRVHFHCLQVLQRLIQDSSRWSALSPEARHNIRLALLSRDSSRDPRFVRTKLGVVLALMIKREFPTSWPRAFDDLLLNQTMAAADVLLWTLVALDEEVISQAGREASDLKDAMRVEAVGKIVSALVHLLASGSDADLGRRALGVLGSLVTWADVSLFADNAAFMRLVLLRLSSPVFCASALAFLQSLVRKGMPVANKTRLIARLGLADAAVALAQLLPRSKLSLSPQQHAQAPPPAAPNTAWPGLGLPGIPDEDICIEVARLVDALGTELLQALQTPDTALATALLDRVVFALFAALECSVMAAQDAVVELASQVASTLPLDQAPRMALAVLSSARYPPTYDFELDCDEDFVEHRRVVKKLFVALCRHTGARALLRPFFRDALQSLLEAATPSCPYPEFAQTEALLFLLHALAEGCPELTAQRQLPENDDARDFDLLLEFVFKARALPQHPHRAVVVMFNELVARYALQLKLQPFDVVASIFSTLTASCFHAHPKVRTRACAVLLRVVRLVSEPRLAETVLLAIQPGLDLSKAQASDALTLFEAVGVVVGGNWTPPERRSGFLRLVIQPLQANLDSAVRQWLQTPADEALVQWAARSVEALSLVVKGFSGKVEDPDVVQLLTLSLQAALETTRVVHPSNAQAGRLVSNARKLCHALVPTVGVALVAFLPAICQALLDPPDADVPKACDLLNQMMNTFKSQMSAPLNAALIPVLRSINAHAAPLLAQPSPSPNDVLEARELEKTLFLFLQAVACSELSSVLLSEDNRPHLLELLGMLAHGLQSGPDAILQRVCALTLQQLLRDWFPLTPVLDVHEQLYVSLKRFFFERVTAASFGATSLSSFDPQDAGCSALLLAVCTLHKQMAERLGPDWLDYLVRVFFPAALCPAAQAEQYVKAITESKNPKELRAHYRRLFMAGVVARQGST